MLRTMLAAMLPLCLGLTTICAPNARATPVPDDLGGQVRAEVDGRIIQFPSLRTDMSAQVQGDLASVTVVQTFVNPTTVPLNATYLFPLNKDAAVHAMQMKVGDEIIEARIARKGEARKTFETAKREGKAAALLEQHRPNMFTQNVANLMPGMPIQVTLRYVQTVPRIDGAYELVMPLVVGPRYVPVANPDTLARAAAPHNDADLAAPSPVGQWSFGPPPVYPPVNALTAPATIDEDRVSIRIEVNAGVDISEMMSATHAINVSADEAVRKRTVTLASGKTIDNRDFVLRYTLAGTDVQAGLLAHVGDETGGTFSLLVEPPSAPAAEEITPREIVFVLDTSGSMGGAPIEASKTFMTHALRALRPNDYFRIIRFSSSASELASGPIAASPSNLRAALTFVNSLTANGGTEVISGLRKAFDIAPMPGTRRMLVFLSDGYVGNEAEILRMVADNIEQAHTYVLGVGTGVNRYLLAEMAHQGRGFMRIIDPTENSEVAATQFARKLDTTVMTDLAIDWGTLSVADVTPRAMPDLFAGDSLRVQGRFNSGGTHTIRITGKVNGRHAALPLQITLPSQPSGEATKAIPLIWARSQIKDNMRELMLPANLRRGGRGDSDLQETVTKLGLSHSLVTQWTSFVAVSMKVINPEPDLARDADVTLPMVKGVGPGAYPHQRPQPRQIPPQQRATNPVYQTVAALQNTFGGASTPEPEAVGGIGMVLIGLWLSLSRWRRRKA